MTPGWQRVQAICDYAHDRISFGYQHARCDRTASEGHEERVGVCRDFAHLAVTLCRCMNIPARYCTGYLGDIGVPIDPAPMDFSAWFEVYLDGRWFTFDARHNHPRIGRIVMARGRDAADVAISTAFGTAQLARFSVVTDEVKVAAGAGFAERRNFVIRQSRDVCPDAQIPGLLSQLRNDEYPTGRAGNAGRLALDTFQFSREGAQDATSPACKNLDDSSDCDGARRCAIGVRTDHSSGPDRRKTHDHSFRLADHRHHRRHRRIAEARPDLRHALYRLAL